MPIPARQIIADILDDLESQIGTTATNHVDIHRAFAHTKDDLNNTFGWQPIERADEFSLRDTRGEPWGPRLVVLVNNMSHIAYWDLDTTAPTPKPFWRVLHKTPAWSRRNQPSHFLRPFSV